MFGSLIVLVWVLIWIVSAVATLTILDDFISDRRKVSFKKIIITLTLLAVVSSPLFLEAVIVDYVLISRSGNQASSILSSPASGIMWQKNWNAATAGKAIFNRNELRLDLTTDQTVWLFRNDRRYNGDLGVIFRGTDEETNIIARAQGLLKIPASYVNETAGTSTKCLPIVKKAIEQSGQYTRLKGFVENTEPTHQWILKEQIFLLDLLTEADDELKKYGITIIGIQLPMKYR